MYSPEINSILIKPLFHLGKARKQPMTQLVSELLYEALSTRELPDAAKQEFEAARSFYNPQTQPTPFQEAA